MEDLNIDKHYEEKFEFPLWKMIKQRAEEKDTSYLAALNEVLPEWDKTIRYKDIEFENAALNERWEELDKLGERGQQLYGENAYGDGWKTIKREKP